MDVFNGFNETAEMTVHRKSLKFRLWFLGTQLRTQHSNLIAKSPALPVEQVPAGTGLLEGRDNESETLVLDLSHVVGEVDLQPDVHLHVVLLAVDPVGKRRDREREASHPLLPLGGHWGLHLQ